MEWLRVGKKIINTKHLRAVERKGRDVIFRLGGDSVVVQFNNETKAQRWFDGFWGCLELQEQTQTQTLDTTGWDLDE